MMRLRIQTNYFTVIGLLLIFTDELIAGENRWPLNESFAPEA
jgi:hypothetical protein